jgi:hypothetical protein
MTRSSACLLALALAGGNALPGRAGEGPIHELRVYYFGNSLTGNTMPTFHEALGQTAGREWVVARSQGPGWQVWQHLYLENAQRHRDRIAAGGWDAIVVQPFGGRLFHEVVTEMWQGKVKFDGPTDVGDLHGTAGLIELLLEGNFNGRALVYSDWPGITVKVSKEQNELSKDLKHAVRWHEIMEPFRRAFDYEQKWLAEYNEDEAAQKVPWKREAIASRDHDYQLMEALKERFPDLWKEGRLELIPAGDVFLALDRRFRDGAARGIRQIGDYYANGVHIRSGCPRYTVTATFYATLFRARPHGLDWKVYNDQSTHLNKDKWICCEKDLGVHLEITPERAKLINDTIWEVVAGHPYTGVER